MKKQIEYGLVSPTFEPEHYVLGAVGSIDKEVLEVDSDWTESLVEFEKQRKKYDTYNCTGFNTTTPIEMLILKLTGKMLNYSDRFVGVISGTYPPGNDPHKVAVAINKQGLIKEESLPFSSDLKTVDEYYSYKGSSESKCLDEAKDFPYLLQHYWIWKWTDKLNDTERRVKIKEALLFSPLGVAVTAWYKEGDVYVDKGRPNTHWCVLYGIADNGYKIFDTYDGGLKTLSFDHNIGYAKGYWLAEKKEVISFIQKVIELLKNLLLINLMKEKQMPEEINLTNREKLLQASLDSIGIDVSPNDIATDELACVESLCNVVQKVLPTFPILTYTPFLYKHLQNDKRFKQTLELKAGNIIISPTEYGLPGRIGHAGIIGNNNTIMSNTSKDGKWKQNYTIDSWVKKFRDEGGFPIYVFEIID